MRKRPGRCSAGRVARDLDVAEAVGGHTEVAARTGHPVQSGGAVHRRHRPRPRSAGRIGRGDYIATAVHRDPEALPPEGPTMMKLVAFRWVTVQAPAPP